jgi:hypothetical protein
MKTSHTLELEPAVTNTHHHLLCWKSVIGGLLISIMAYMVLAALGAGVAGLTAENLINHEEGGSALATATGLWLGLSAVIALFCGSYFSLRISRFVTTKVGAAHGFVIASVFFILMVWGAGGMLANVARGMGSIAQQDAHGISALSANPVIQDKIYSTLGTTNLKSPPQEVAQGLAARLLAGETDSAKSYYAYQTGLPQAEADAKVNQLKGDLDNAVKITAERTARVIADTGWSLFVTFLVGLIAAVIGGRVGAHANVERPFAAQSTSPVIAPRGFAMATENGSVLPYFVGWLFGVPVSILFLIALLRTVF